MNLPADQLFPLAWIQFWQVTALILAVGLLTRLGCRQRPHLAYVLWMVVIAKCLTPPLWSSPLGVFSWAQARRIEPAADLPRAASAPPLGPAPRLAEPVEPIATEEAVAAGAPRGLIAETVQAREPDENAWRTSLPDVCLAVWLLGVALLGSVVAARWLRSCRRLKQSMAAAPPAFVLLVEALVRRLRLRRKVRLWVTSTSTGPASLGIFRPTVVLPEALLLGKTPAQVEPILAHELIHLRRGDVAFGWLQLLAQVLWWFHPLVWWASRQCCRQSERCCDEEVVAGLGCRPKAYARSLVDVLEFHCGLKPAIAFPGVRPAEVTAKRLEDIMKRARKFHRHTPAWCWAVLLIAAAMILPARPFLVAGDTRAASHAEKEQAPSAAAAGAQTPAPPLTYNAVSDTKYYPKPPLPKLGPAGFIFKDPVFGCPMVRVSDEKTAGGSPLHTPAGGVQNTWNTDSTLLVVMSEGGRAIPFQFDPETLKVSRIPGLAMLPGISGDTPFSYHERDVCYGKDPARGVLVKFNFTTRQMTDVCNVTKVTGLPVVGGHLGMFTISANDVLCVCFGGPTQNRDMYCLVYDMKNNTHHVWNTQEGTIDGKPVPGAPSVLMHACGIDASGRYVSATVIGLWFWDTQTGKLFQVPGLNGHRVFGYGDMVYSGQFVYQKLDPEGTTTPNRLLSLHGFAYDTHTSWNNARQGILVPVVASSEHAEEMGDPKSPCGDEVFAVATDSNQKVWRFCHTRTILHAPTRDAAGNRVNPRGQQNATESQPSNFWDTPRGNVSQDGRFFMFTSNWEESVGKDSAGRFRQDVFIVKLDNGGAPAVVFPERETPAGEKPAVAGRRRPDAAAGKSAAGDMDFNRVRQLMEKRRSGQTLTAEEQAELDRALASRAGGRSSAEGQPQRASQSSGKSSASDVDMNRARQLLEKQRSGQQLTPDEQDYLEQVKKARGAASRQRSDAGQRGEERQRPDTADLEKPAQNFDKAEQAMGHVPPKGKLTKEEFIKVMQQLAGEMPERAEAAFQRIKKADPGKVTKDEFVTHQRESLSGRSGRTPESK